MSESSNLSGETDDFEPLDSEIRRFNLKKDGFLMFTRFPVPGKTKTRLIPALGAHGAADLQRQMTTHLIKQFRHLSCRQFIKQSCNFSSETDFLPGIDFQLHFAGGTTAQIAGWMASMPFTLSPLPALIPQCDGSLGERLAQAFAGGFAQGLGRILVAGSDCPALNEAKIYEALSLLESYDVVLGPALDGGYYLVGSKRLHGCLFENIAWGTDVVLAQTRAIAAQNNLSVALLDPLPDIDRPEDLPLWYALKEKAQASSSSPQSQL